MVFFMNIEIFGGSEIENPEVDTIFDVYVQDFDDNYHRLSMEPKSELERRVRNISSTYKNLNDFRLALIDYYEWMDYLESKYGGHDLLKKMIKDGVEIEDYIPKKPGLKARKYLRNAYKNNIIVSDVGRELINEDKFTELMEYMDDYAPDASTIPDNIATSKEMDEVEAFIEKLNPVSDYRKVKYDGDIDFLNEYFRGGSKPTKKDKKRKKKHDKKKTRRGYDFGPSLIDYCTGRYLDMIDDGEDTTEEDEAYTPFGGVLISYETSAELNFYRKLGELGWDDKLLLKRAHMGKQMTKIYNKTEKQKKKAAKKKSKFEDRLLGSIIDDSGFDSIDDYEAYMLDMTSSNIFS